MDELWSNNDYRYYLAHHGILGQKWGERNGPPYPLDGSDHSASEKKAGWRKSLGGVFKKKDKKVAEPARIGDVSRKEYQPKNDYEKERLERYKADTEKARNASTDEEHDRLQRIADTRNEVEEKKYSYGGEEYSYYSYSDKNADYSLNDTSDDTIQTIHNVQDNFKELNSLARASAQEYAKQFSDREGGVSNDKPVVSVYGKDDVMFIFGATGSMKGGAFDVEVDIKNKKASAASYND